MPIDGDTARIPTAMAPSKEPPRESFLTEKRVISTLETNRAEERSSSN